LEDVVVVVDLVTPAATSFSGLSTDAELACHIIIVPFTTCTLATTIDVIITEFSGTYRLELL
jgi:CheY-specific phosphatase CheX